jgi:hypothetical protein
VYVQCIGSILYNNSTSELRENIVWAITIVGKNY